MLTDAERKSTVKYLLFICSLQQFHCRCGSCSQSYFKCNVSECIVIKWGGSGAEGVGPEGRLTCHWLGLVSPCSQHLNRPPWSHWSLHSPHSWPAVEHKDINITTVATTLIELPSTLMQRSIMFPHQVACLRHRSAHKWRLEGSKNNGEWELFIPLGNHLYAKLGAEEDRTDTGLSILYSSKCCLL